VTFHVQCRDCLAFELVDCICPPSGPDAPPGHVPPCPAGDLHAVVTCRPGRGCCAEPHSHAEACDSCPGGHGPCPQSDTARCPVQGDNDGPCPGGHCGTGVPGCTVCRVLIVTALDGSAHLGNA
jgi:hypothetical protein